MSVVYIGLGSNLGNREENCHAALDLLEKKGVRILKRSSLIETKPWGFTDQPCFMNMTAEAETSLLPHELLALLIRTEEEIGRERTVTWGPRIIDLDILLYDDLRIETNDLRIPHPLMHERDFVLRPLAEIAPEKVHPVLHRTIADLLELLKK